MSRQADSYNFHGEQTIISHQDSIDMVILSGLQSAQIIDATNWLNMQGCPIPEVLAKYVFFYERR